ncbi:hypothetical protein RB653_009636 [Dictyostelium firmibasis]|uniref:Uncharacterized protein n=1 Tax=Dictyostelium firmibasis TaxID=79012 RepID=A0AAN7TVV9_9MYCE
MNEYSLSDPFNYENDLEFSKNNKTEFYNQVAKKYVKWDKIYGRVNSGDNNNPEWFKGGMLNACYNFLDVNVENPNRRNQIAIIHECPLMGVAVKVTYFELWEKVCIMSRALKNLGIGKGDGVMIFMPSYIETAIAILSCTRLGAINCVVVSSFSSHSLAVRIDNFKPKLLFTSTCSIKSGEYIYFTTTVIDALKEATHSIENIIVHSRTDIIDSPSYNRGNVFNIPNSMDWESTIKGLEPLTQYTSVEAEHPLLYAYTSGTTGTPKCLIIETSSLLVQTSYLIHRVHGINPGDIFFSTTDIGWVFSQNLNLYGALLIGVTSIFHEGDPTTPSPNIYFKIVEKYSVNKMITVPTEIRLIRKLDPTGESISKLNLSSLQFSLVVGERLDKPTADYLTNVTGTFIVDCYGSSEANSTFITNIPYSIPWRAKSIGKAVPGFNIDLVKENGEIITKPNEIGEVVVKLLLPPSFSTSLYHNPKLNEGYLKKYPGYFATGDIAYFDEDGHFYIVSRTDDVAKVGSEVVFCGLVEETIQKHPSIMDCCVVSVNDDIYGERTMAVAIFKSPINIYTNRNEIESILQELNKNIVEQIDEISKIKYLIPVKEVPRTKSGKKIRHLISKIFNGQDYVPPPTISNLEVLKRIEDEISDFKSNLLDQGFNTLKYT